AMGMCAGSLAMPILAGGAMIDSGTLDPAMAKTLEATLLSNEALDQRIDLALKAIRASEPCAAGAAKRRTKTRGKS
ncbi:MAG TPA: hypothetical protein VF348_10470, partial [Usitatibacter sp.]